MSEATRKSIEVYKFFSTFTVPVRIEKKERAYSKIVEILENTERGTSATITTQRGEYLPFRVELDNNGQGHYFKEYFEALAYAKKHAHA